MARLFGTEIPNEKRIEASLPYIYGIGRSTSKRILEQAGINPDIRTGQLTDEQLTKIVQVITTDGILIEGDLRREKQSILKRLTSINWSAPPPRPSGTRPAYPYECPHP